MKAITSTALVLIVLLIVLLIGIGIMSQFNVVRGYLSSAVTGCGTDGNNCCDNDWCVSGLACSDGMCISSESLVVGIDESYLVYDSITPSESDRDAFFTAKSGLGEEDCSNAGPCTGCVKMDNIQNAKTCTECGDCGSDGKCGSCNGCESAENGAYKGLFDCMSCTGCQDVEYGFSPKCDSCSYCDGILDIDEVVKSSESSCGHCYWCEESSVANAVCQSCWDCESSNKWCMQCKKSGSTVCEHKSDYEICDRVKEAMVSYDGYPIDVTDYSSLPLPWSSGYDFATNIRNILVKCINDATMPMNTDQNIVQKVCNYPTPLIFTSYHYTDSKYTNPEDLYSMLTSKSVTGESGGILFNDCGIVKVPTGINGKNLMMSSSPVVFESTTVPRTSSGDVAANVKLVVGNASFGDQSSSSCSYDLYICSQQALATSLNDPILKFYEDTAYMEESKMSYTARVWDPSIFEIGSEKFEVNVTGIRFQKFKMSRDGNYDAAHIFDAMIAGLRDHFAINSYLNSTIDFYCKRTGLYQSLDDCYSNDVQVVMNDRMPWKIVDLSYGVDSLALPSYKYAYHGPMTSELEIELVLFAYSSNITGINNTIFVTPVISINMPKMKYNVSVDSGKGKVCITARPKDFVGPIQPQCTDKSTGLEISTELGADVEIEATADSGWKFTKFKVEGYDGTVLKDYTESKFTLKAASSGHFKAVFEKKSSG